MTTKKSPASQGQASTQKEQVKFKGEKSGWCQTWPEQQQKAEDGAAVCTGSRGKEFWPKNVVPSQVAVQYKDNRPNNLKFKIPPKDRKHQSLPTHSMTGKAVVEKFDIQWPGVHILKEKICTGAL